MHRDDGGFLCLAKNRAQTTLKYVLDEGLLCARCGIYVCRGCKSAHTSVCTRPNVAAPELVRTRLDPLLNRGPVSGPVGDKPRARIAKTVLELSRELRLAAPQAADITYPLSVQATSSTFPTLADPTHPSPLPADIIYTPDESLCGEPLGTGEQSFWGPESFFPGTMRQLTPSSPSGGNFATDEGPETTEQPVNLESSRPPNTPPADPPTDSNDATNPHPAANPPSVCDAAVQCHLTSPAPAPTPAPAADQPMDVDQTFEAAQSPGVGADHAVPGDDVGSVETASPSPGPVSNNPRTRAVRLDPPRSPYFLRLRMRDTTTYTMIPCSSIGKGVSVKRSELPRAGKGLFATKEYERGDFITWYEGDRITEDDANDLDKLGLATHICRIGGVVMDARNVECVNGKGGASWANSNPAYTNSRFVVYNFVIYLKATRKIRNGDEIYVFYHPK
jgi:hypothetical protein